MPNKIPKPKPKNFDLLERTAKFGEDTIEFVQILPRNEINRPLISQVVRSVTSVGANYMEADGAVSKKDFENKIGLCRKESKESMHWFRMIAKANPNESEKCRKLWKEAQELVWIFSSIISNSRNKKDK
ncbi:MAG: four helix bundle protein [Candidatus Moranbacteria bacterium CG06_land_8_20_14_3_00_40_12]|nr:MAG: four helix bundle protein [Candidatus Moranbacteria bacterium CG23_combo_of_CG06-09_8_20_14_all_40_16]PIU80751.1 MAG: four helix bundle protein [Candidatus Moranbacteria bacterium CG06_land_8_20_14_3_00_40_12]